MKRKLIEQSQKKFIVCDNTGCNYEIPFDEKLNLLEYIDEPCPCCGENLLTIEDYITSLKLQKAIDFINKWFGWLTWFSGKVKEEDKTSVRVHVHKGINLSTDE